MSEQSARTSMFVYRLICPEGKSYVGVTTRGADTRWQEHVWSWQRETDRKRRTKLHRAFDRHHPNTWRREILFETDDSEILGQKEDEFILMYDCMNSGYNIHRGGALGPYGSEFDAEHREAIAEAKRHYWNSPAAAERKAKMSERWKETNPARSPDRVAWNKGIPHTEEHRKAIGDGLRGKARGPMSEEHRRNLSESLKGRYSEAQYAAAKRNAEARRGSKQSENQKRLVAEANKKEFIVTGPSGETLRVSGLKDFCKERGLDHTNIGRRSGSKGWKAVRAPET